MHIQIGDAKGVSIATRLIGNHKVILNKNIDFDSVMHSNFIYGKIQGG